MDKTQLKSLIRECIEEVTVEKLLMEQLGLTEEEINNPIVLNTFEEAWEYGNKAGIPIEEITEKEYKSLMENVKPSSPNMLFN